MFILGLNKTTLLDYPCRVAATIFTGGCNFLCPYCHNKDIVLKSNAITPYTETEIFSFLQKRKHVLTGVCITGGEPTLHDDLPDFIKHIKELGYAVKLDTNGTNPQMLEYLIKNNLIDYCAMDIKNAPQKYAQTIGLQSSSALAQTSTCPGCTNDALPANAYMEHSSILSAVTSSIHFLITQQAIPYEFRTTVVRELHSSADLPAIADWIAGAKAYFLQSYVDSDGVLCPGYHAPTKETLESYVSFFQKYIPNTMLRGI